VAILPVTAPMILFATSAMLLAICLVSAQKLIQSWRGVHLFRFVVAVLPTMVVVPPSVAVTVTWSADHATRLAI
jgi:hypothetical protein